MECDRYRYYISVHIRGMKDLEELIMGELKSGCFAEYVKAAVSFFIRENDLDILAHTN